MCVFVSLYYNKTIGDFDKQIMGILDLLVILKTQYFLSRKRALTILYTSLPITQVRHPSPGYFQHHVYTSLIALNSLFYICLCGHFSITLQIP